MTNDEETFTEAEYNRAWLEMRAVSGQNIEVGTQLHQDIVWAMHVITKYEEQNG